MILEQVCIYVCMYEYLRKDLLNSYVYFNERMSNRVLVRLCMYVCMYGNYKACIPYTHGRQPDEFDAESRKGLHQHVVHEEAAHLRQRAAQQTEGGRRVRVNVLVGK